MIMKKLSFIFILLVLSVMTVSAKSTFKSVNNYGDFSVDNNYIIAAYDEEEDSWYALSAYNDKYAVKISDPRNEITLTDKEVKNSEYVLKCSKKEASNKIKLRSNLVDEEQGKKYSLYLSKNQIFNLGGGTITLSINTVKDSTGLYPVYMGRNGQSALTFDTNTNSFGYKNISLGIGGGTKVYVFTDAVTMLDQTEAVNLKKIDNAYQLFNTFKNINIYEKFQIVYTDTDGKKYILTESGTKEVKLDKNGILVTKDYMYFINDKENPGSYGVAFYDTTIISNGKYLNLNDFTQNFFVEDSVLNSFELSTIIYNSLNGDRRFTDENNTKVTYTNDDEDIFAYSNMKFSVYLGNHVYLGWNSEKKEIVPVSDTQAAKFDVYTSDEIYDIKHIMYNDRESDFSYDYYKASNTPDICYDINENKKCLGWTTDPDTPLFISLEDTENLLYYDTDKREVSINKEVIKKYSIVQNLSDIKSQDDTIQLYSIYYEYPTIQEGPAIGQVDGKNIIGVTDWKNIQEQKTEEQLNKKEKNQGSIFIEVYLDGKLYIPKYKMYYRYENDNTTDITIKFLHNEITDVSTYMYDQDDYYKNPNYTIVGAYAQQGGSEEGLYKNFNWLTRYGGQLDNVQGGSTVKIYLSSKYTLKYYLNDVEYKEDKYAYVPTITKNIISSNSKNSNYVINSSSNSELLNKTSVTEYFRESTMERGKYFSFSYEISEDKHLAEISPLPNEKVTKDYWVIKDNSGAIKYKALPNEYMKHETIDNHDYIYVGEEDDIHTIHLHAYTLDNEPTIDEDLIVLSVPKEVENPNTTNRLKVLIIFIAISLLLVLMYYKKNKIQKLELVS